MKTRVMDQASQAKYKQMTTSAFAGDSRTLAAVEIDKQVYVGTIKQASKDYKTGELHVWQPQPLGEAQAACAAAGRKGSQVPERLYKVLAPLYGDTEENNQHRYLVTHDIKRASSAKNPWPVTMKWNFKCTVISVNVRMQTGAKPGHMDRKQWEALAARVRDNAKLGWDFYVLKGRGGATQKKRA